MSTLSIDNYGVVEMDASTMRETDGGTWRCDPSPWLTEAKAWVAKEWSDFCDGFSAGFKSAVKH